MTSQFIKDFTWESTAARSARGASKVERMEDTKILFHAIAAAFGMSESEFQSHLPALVASGFPRPEGEAGHFSSTSLLEWLVSQQEQHVALLNSIKSRLAS